MTRRRAAQDGDDGKDRTVPETEAIPGTGDGQDQASDGSGEDLLNRQAGAVRTFNRFYTRQIGLLEDGLLESPFSLTESRVLYELAHREGLTATGLGRDLGLDAGYLSRILKKFEAKGFLKRLASAEDGRRSLLTLTGEGRAAFAPLNARSQQMIADLLTPLTNRQRAAVVAAMGLIRELLGDAPAPKVSYIIRPPEPGDVSWAVSRQAALYATEYGWDGSFETLVAEIGAKFLAAFDAEHERCWIAERDGQMVGSVFLVCESAQVAKLRMLYLDPEARGLGIGRRLVQECIKFARAKGYATLTLWTNDILHAARRIYEAEGFTLVKAEPHRSFGKDLVGQYWARDL